MLVLRALLLEHVDLRQRGLEQRLLLRHVEARDGAQVVARRHQLERAPLQRDRARQHVEFDIGRAQVEIAARHVGRQQQPRVGEVGRRLLGRGGGAFHAALHAAREVELVAGVEREREVVLHRRRIGGVVVGQRPVGRDLEPRSARAQAELRVLRGRARGQRGARLREPRAGDGERGAAGHGPVLQRVELRVAVALPPRALVGDVVGRAFAPRCLELPAHGQRGFGRLVVGADRTARGQHHGGERDRREGGTAHAHAGSFLAAAGAAAGAAPGLAPSAGASGATATTSPSASESEGLSTMRSVPASPSTTSTFSP